MTASPPPWALPSSAQFRADGFAWIPQLIDATTVNQLRQAYDEIITGKVDCGSSDRMLGGLTRQVINPSHFHPLFANNPALTAAKEVAAQLLGWDQPELHFDMLINKVPGNHNTTPWHQDAAYRVMPVTPAGTAIASRTLQFWLALDPVDAFNGCMHFSRGQSLDTLLRHRIAGGDPSDEGRLLAVEDDVAIESVVCCPLPSGGCTVHSEGCLHMTTGNVTSDQQRRAYIFSLSV